MFALLLPCAQQADASPRFIEQSYRAESANAFGRAGWVRADLTGDGVPELIVDGTVEGILPGSYTALIALDAAEQGAVRRTSSILISGSQPHLPNKLLAWRSAAGERIVTITRPGTVVVHAGFPMREERRFDCITAVSSAAIGDIDGDGVDELVTGIFDSINVYSLATGQWLRSHQVYGVTDIALAQLDADPALEMILGGTMPGLIVDGATFATDWSYVDGFGASIVVGKLGGQGMLRWAGNVQSRFSVFQTDPWSPLWSAPGGFSHIAAIEDPGGNELVSVVSWPDAIEVYDATTRQLRFRIPEPSPGLIVNATAGFDVDADGVSEIAIAAGRFGHDTQAAAIAFADAADGSYRWQWNPARGAYTTAAWGDIDGDGRDELVTAAQLASAGSGGNLEIFDADSDRSEWRSPLMPSYSDDFLQLSTSRVQLRRRAAEGRDIVLVGQTGTERSSHLIVVDGVTRTISFDRFGGFSENFVDLVLIARADGSVDDFGLAVASETNAFSVLQRRSGGDGALLWESPHMFGRIHQVLHVPAAGESAGELVAVMLSGLYAYDAANGTERWTLPVENVGTAYIEAGVGGAELAVFSDSGNLAFYDASTRALLRQVALPGRIGAVTALGGDVRQMIVAADGRLNLLDGATGQIHARSEPIAEFPWRSGHIAARRLSGDVWQLASGTSAALYRHRLELSGTIFRGDFDRP